MKLTLVQSTELTQVLPVTCVLVCVCVVLLHTHTYSLRAVVFTILLLTHKVECGIF